MSQALWLLLNTVGSLLATACLVRALGHYVSLSPHNPVSQFVVAVTDWLVKPLRRVLPTSRSTDWSSLAAAVIVSVLLAVTFILLFPRARIPSFGYAVLIGVGWLFKWAIWLVIALVIVQAVLSWVNPYAPVAPAFDQLTRPFLAPIRKIVPLLGGVDLSPLVLIVLAQVALMLLQSLFFDFAGIQL